LNSRDQFSLNLWRPSGLATMLYHSAFRAIVYSESAV
jgi:hypothetical protein